jgi:hypothetical protein
MEDTYNAQNDTVWTSYSMSVAPTWYRSSVFHYHYIYSLSSRAMAGWRGHFCWILRYRTDIVSRWADSHLGIAILDHFAFLGFRDWKPLIPGIGISLNCRHYVAIYKLAVSRMGIGLWYRYRINIDNVPTVFKIHILVFSFLKNFFFVLGNDMLRSR